MTVIVVLFFTGHAWIVPPGWEPRAAPDPQTCSKRVRKIREYLHNDPRWSVTCKTV